MFKPIIGRVSLALVIMLSAMFFLNVSEANAASGRGFNSYVLGNDANVTRTTSYGLMLAGGGTDVDDAMRWMISKSGGGDFVVLRASGTDAYNPYIYSELGGVDSVETFIITSRTGASSTYVNDRVRNAEALFIAGGDQANYVNYWKDTALESSINSLVAKGVPIGGTSAGLAVLGQFVYDATRGSVYSDEALYDPYDRYITFTRDFLAMTNMSRTITDSHFANRDRMGRLITFLARLVEDDWTTQAKGIGVDEQTAVLVEANGSATIKGTGAAYLLRTPSGYPQVCVPDDYLTYRNVSVYKMSGAATFNFSTWTGSGGVSYTITSEAGVLSSSRGSIY
jgi:cyanophycinase